MSLTLNSSATAHAARLIARNAFNVSSAWSFSTEDGNNLLGNPDSPDWKNYAGWFLAKDDAADKETKAHYKYPFGKGGKVYRSALVAARQRAGQQRNASSAAGKEIFAVAGDLIAAIDAKDDGGKFFEHYYQRAAPPLFQPLIGRDAATGRMLIKSVKPALRVVPVQADEDGVVTSVISTAAPDRCNDVMLPDGVALKHFYANPVVLWMHNDSIPAVARNVGIAPNAQGLVAKTYFNRVTQLSKDLYQLYKNGDMFAFSVGFIPLAWEDSDVDTEQHGGGNAASITRRTYTKWELLEYSLVNIPMNPDAVALSADAPHARAALERIVRRAVQKGVIGGEPETLRYLGLDPGAIRVASQPAHERALPPNASATIGRLQTFGDSDSTIHLFSSHFTPIMNDIHNTIENTIEKSGRELSAANAHELACHINALDSGIAGLKMFLRDRGYDMDAMKDLSENDAAGNDENPGESGATGNTENTDGDGKANNATNQEQADEMKSAGHELHAPALEEIYEDDV